MKWRYTPKPLMDYSQWHPHFAWKPVRIGDYKYWLCTVMRRAIPTRNTKDFIDIMNRNMRLCGWDNWEYQEACYYC